MSVRINLNALDTIQPDEFFRQMIELSDSMQKGGKFVVLNDSEGRHLICDEIAQESIHTELQSDDLRSLLLRADELNLRLRFTGIRDVLKRILDEKPKCFPNQMTHLVLQRILSFMEIKDLISFGLTPLYASAVLEEIKRRNPDLVENPTPEQTPEQQILKAQEKWEKLESEKNFNKNLASSAMKVKERVGLDFFAFSFESSIHQEY